MAIENKQRARKRKSKSVSATKVFAGRYAYKKPLGRGAGGSVYLAEDLRKGEREVALKVLSADAYNSVQGKMLRREFEILSKLSHPNLVRVFDYGSLPDGGVYLAEEYIDGFSLQDARALLEPAALIDITLQLLQGLSYLHAMGMIHRDIKPANVMLLWLDDASALPMAKLVDFGLSSMDPKRDTLRGGTRSYMAPEVIRGEKGEQRSDLYSLGVTLYYALCGVLPFGPRSKDDPPPTEEDFRPPEPHRLNAEVPLELSRFTMALLRQLPDVDFADAGEALQALAQDTGVLEQWSAGRMANSLDVAAAPVIRGYFERGILARRLDEDDLLLEWLSTNESEAMGQLYLIRGADGAGKTRLLHDVQASSKLGGHVVLESAGYEGMGPYALLTDLVTQTMELALSQDQLGLESYRSALLARQLMTSLGIETAGERVAPFVEQAWMRAALEEAVGLLKPQQLVFFIDELHLADEASLEVLEDWFRAVKVRHRPDIVAALTEGEVCTRLQRGQGVQLLPIEGVEHEDVADFFGEQLALRGLSDVWIEDVNRAARGRPAYVEELCRYLIDAGLLRRQSASRWEARLEEVEARGVPASLRESLRRRVTAVGAAGRECLELLSLMERPLLWESVRKLLVAGGVSSSEAERTLKTVLWRNLVEIDLRAGGRFVRLIHDELGEAVSDMISPEWRRALHRRIGQQLTRDWRRGAARAAEAAHHLAAGGNLDLAAHYFIMAAEEERADGDFSRAFALFKRADEALADGPERALVSLHLANLALAHFETASARTWLKRAEELSLSCPSAWLRWQVLFRGAELMLYIGDVMQAERWRARIDEEGVSEYGVVDLLTLDARLLLGRGKLELASEMLQRCVERAGAGVVLYRQASALGSLAHVQLLCGQSALGLKSYQQAIEMADRLGDEGLRAEVLTGYGADLRRIGSPVESRDALLEALDLALQAERAWVVIEALFQLAWTLATLGNRSDARRRGSEAFRLAQELGHRASEEKIALFLGGLVLRSRAEQDIGAEQLERVALAFDAREDYRVERAELLMATGDLMIELQLADVGARLLQRGRNQAFRMGAHGLLPRL
ncbi:serine/threonine protein kinase [Lujinxingia sediminis]|uniref:Serine/threonine protein kinase n=1 Tax=Lujinxingia sediminis TaxID=2480984 RepID=A0ABY0CX81_9DELT|nr:serine/threonine-protein kinase [Lujinxingia sediminis]RVU48492.1 serine/threonine protein kinase [Lujinxingia sediminis]